MKPLNSKYRWAEKVFKKIKIGKKIIYLKFLIWYSYFTMKKMTKEEKHQQCMREIKGTLIVTVLCFLWHVATAFILNGKGLYFLGMPAWFSVSVFGTIVIALVGVRYLLKHVFVDFEYDDEEEED